MFFVFLWCFLFFYSMFIVYLVFGVRGVHPLLVSAGLQQNVDGVQLQQNLTRHAVKKGDVGQSCRRQEEHLPAGGALTQL